MKTTILLGVALVWPLAFWAADNFQPLNVKPGLWETTMTNEMSGMPPMPAEALARLTPEQRAKIEAAMKARAAQGAKTTVHKNCITKEQLAKPLKFGDESEKNCKYTFVTSSGSKQEIHVECTQGTMNSKGDVHVEAVNSENIKGSSQMSVGDGGRTMNIKMGFTAKWIGASCGELKDKDD